jgi:hypothetical protein
VERFGTYLTAMRIFWPRLANGALALGDDTFRDMAKAYPVLQPLRELRHALSELRLERLAVGADGRNRVMLSAFASRTGRNQPSNNKFLFGPATWVRSLIRPGPGMALAYVDFSSQEMGIAAALSGDEALLEAYRSGDIYFAFAKAGLAPLTQPRQLTARSATAARQWCSEPCTGWGRRHWHGGLVGHQSRHVTCFGCIR